MAFVYLLTVGAFRGLDPALEESAHTCGAGPIITFVRVTLPIVAPAVIGVFILSFIRSLESFETPLFLGSPVGIYMFTNEIYRAINFYDPPRFNLAAGLGVTIIAITFVLVHAQWRILGGREFVTITGKASSPRLFKLRKWRWPAFVFCMLNFALDCGFPIIMLVAGSFTAIPGVYSWDNLTLANYRIAFSDTVVIRSLYNTVLVALLVAFLGVIVSGLAAYVIARTQFWARRPIDLMCWLPWTLPGIVLGVGMLWAVLMVPGYVALYGTLWILVVAFLIKGLPLGVRALTGTMVQVHRELEESARIHGASWSQTAWYILFPLIRPGVLAAAILFVIAAVRDLSTAVLLYGYGSEVLTVAMLRYWLEGQWQIVSVLSLAMLLLLVIIVIFQRWVLGGHAVGTHGN